MEGNSFPLNPHHPQIVQNLRGPPLVRGGLHRGVGRTQGLLVRGPAPSVLDDDQFGDEDDNSQKKKRSNPSQDKKRCISNVEKSA